MAATVVAMTFWSGAGEMLCWLMMPRLAGGLMPALVGEALQRRPGFPVGALEGLQVAGGQPGRCYPWVAFRAPAHRGEPVADLPVGAQDPRAVYLEPDSGDFRPQALPGDRALRPRVPARPRS